MAHALSGLQKEVLALYRRYVPLVARRLTPTLTAATRRALRMVLTKPPATQDKFRLFVRYNFRTQASMASARDVAAIEHLIRKGRRQLETYEDAGVRDCWVSKEMRDWEKREARQWPKPSQQRT